MMAWKKLMGALAVLGVAAALLYGVSAVLEPVAQRNQSAQRQQLMQRLLPGSRTFVPEEYNGINASIMAVFKGETGYVVESRVEGYVDDMTLWVGVDNSGAVTGLTVRDMAETWGLGRQAMLELPFLEQFLGTKADAALGENVEAITGATVTAKAVVKAVNSAAGFVSGADVSSGATEWGN